MLNILAQLFFNAISLVSIHQLKLSELQTSKRISRILKKWKWTALIYKFGELCGSEIVCQVQITLAMVIKYNRKPDAFLVKCHIGFRFIGPELSIFFHTPHMQCAYNGCRFVYGKKELKWHSQTITV